MAYQQQLPQPPQPPTMPANGGIAGGRQHLPSAAYGQQQQMVNNKRQQLPTPNAMPSVQQQPNQRGPAQQQLSRMVQSVAPTKTATGGGNGNHTNAIVAPVSALALLQRKRRRYDSSSSAGAATTAGNSNIGPRAGANNGYSNSNNASRGSGAPTIRLPPPLYLLLPPPQLNSNPSNSSSGRHQHQLLAALANLATSRGIFEIGQGITEISGEAGSGKTQLCLRLCVSCALSTYSVDDGGDGDGGENGDGGKGRQQQQQMAMPPPPPPAVNVKNPYATSSHAQRVQPRPAVSRQRPQQQLGNRQGRQRQHYRAVYVTMGEGLSPSQIAYRLGQMATASTSSASSVSSTNTHHGNGSGQGNSDSTAILNRILTRSVRNEDELLDLVRRELPAMLRRGWGDDRNACNVHSSTASPSAEGRIGLVVLDSIAGMFRLPDVAKDRGTAFFARRSEILFGLSAQLRKLGDEYGVAFVVANQVTAGKAASGGGPRIMGGSGGGSGSGGNAIPALGLSWSNCINTRFVLRRSETLSSRMGVSSVGSGGGSGATNANGTQQQNQQAQAPVSMFKRWARVAMSPVLPPVSVPFVIDVRGGVATENPK